MKSLLNKVLCLSLVLICVMGCASCSDDGRQEQETEVTYSMDYKDRSALEAKHADSTERIKIWRYRAAGMWNDASMTDTIVTGMYASVLLEELSSLEPTDQKDTFDVIKGGMTWVDDGNGNLYRIYSDGKSVAKVSDFYGEGTLLRGGDGILQLANKLCSSPGTNSYEAEYRDGKLNVSQTYKTAADVKMKITDLHFEAKTKVDEDGNTVPTHHIIDVELVSTVDKTVIVEVNASMSGGCIVVMRDGDSKEVKLKAGKPKTVSLSFGADSDGESYYVSVTTEDNSCRLLMSSSEKVSSQ